MQGILSFANDGNASKRRKALRACQRCKESKKRCTVIDGSSRCRRCAEDGWACSFAGAEIPRPLETQVEQNGHPIRHHATNVDSKPADASPISARPPTATYRTPDSASLNPSVPSLVSDLPPMRPTSVGDGATEGAGASPATGPAMEASQASPSLLTPQACQSVGRSVDGPRSELRYATMLSLLDGKGTAQPPQGQLTKLIAGTNPLSALLRKDLKHKIVTNSCSFRTPDPTDTARLPALVRGSGIHSCDWERSYRSIGLSGPRLQYLRAIGCFKLPSSSRCAELLEIFFSFVHPMVPIIDRKDFLACYYGGDEPPSLVILIAVFLSASRYAQYSGQPSGDGVSELRTTCDELHNKLRALVEAEMTSDRIAVIQASILASLHWEGREGLNSAIDNLSIAIRACQEMGLHRKQQDSTTPPDGQQTLHRRLWWCLYAMDRFNAAQEGTPFLINELDCDVDLLTAEDIAGEDQLTRSVLGLNISLARLLEDAVRSLYMPGEDHTTLFSSRGALIRQRLDRELEQLAQQITTKLFSSGSLSEGPSGNEPDRYSLFGSILLTHLDAVRILVHRPFLLYPEPQGLEVYASRDACRAHALSISSRLQALHLHGQLRYSWPFTVYAVVNSLLIFWYDISASTTQDPAALSESRKHYASVVQLLRSMGTTWWAAAAKYRLAQALARAADEVQLKATRRDAAAAAAIPATVQRDSNSLRLAQGHPLTPASTTQDHLYNFGAGDWPDVDMFADCDINDYWASIGLDFDLDVACNIFSISDLAGP